MKALFAPSVPWVPAQKSFVPGVGPNPLRLYELLQEQGISSTFADPYPYPWNPFSGKDTLLQSLDPLRALRIALRERDADVVVSVFEGAATSVGALRPLLRLDAALAMWDLGLTNWQLRNKIIDFTLPRIDELLVLGQNQVGYVKQYHAPCASITAIGHYIDADFYRPEAQNPAGYVLTVGEDVGRDFNTLFQATQGLGRQFVVKARRPQSDIPDIRFVRERISHLQLRELYAGSALVVVPTLVTNNACGVSSILEASACGRPLVVSDNPGIRDFIVPGETCLVVPPGDPQALRDAIKNVLADPSLAQRLADGARAFVEKSCTHSAFANRLGAALHHIIATRRQRQSR